MPAWMNVEATLYRPMYNLVYKNAIKITDRYEMTIIKEDVIIYTVILTVALIILTRII